MKLVTGEKKRGRRCVPRDQVALIAKANTLAESEAELIVADNQNGTIYRRNTDWEWAGGFLYYPIGRMNPELVESPGVLHKRIHRRENFWNEVKDCRYGFDNGG